jgi:signal transduction histidine kinase
MKVFAKFLLWFLLASTLCFGATAYLSARREASDVEANVKNDITALGEGLREGLGAEWSLHGEPGVATFLDSVNAKRADVDIAWDRTAPAGAGEAPRATIDESGDVRKVRVVIPVAFPNGTGGNLVVARKVASQGALLKAELLDELWVMGALFAISAMLAVGLGGALIGRPLDRMVQQARRIGEGDFSARLVATTSDEIGVLKRELNSMADRLVETKTKLDAEATARVETLEQLRHLDRLRTVGTLASSLAHELGTPLNVLLIRGQALSAGDVEPDEVKETGDLVVSQVDKMSKIVRQLLDFARQKQDKKSEVSLAEIARRSASLLSSLAKKNKAVIEVDVEEDVSVTGNAEQLEQALSNLMLNGMQAMTHGGELRLSVRSAMSSKKPGSPELLVGIIEVRDQGPGIPDEDLSRIFEPFYTTKPKGLGTGLGLSVASGIVEELGGWVHAESEVGKGSAFALHIPRAT